MLVLDPQIRQDLNKLEAVVFAPHDPLIISVISFKLDFWLKSSVCLKLLGIFNPKLSSDARSLPNFVNVALTVLSLYFKAKVAAQDALKYQQILCNSYLFLANP